MQANDDGASSTWSAVQGGPGGSVANSAVSTPWTPAPPRGGLLSSHAGDGGLLSHVDNATAANATVAASSSTPQKLPPLLDSSSLDGGAVGKTSSLGGAAGHPDAAMHRSNTSICSTAVNTRANTKESAGLTTTTTNSTAQNTRSNTKESVVKGSVGGVITNGNTPATSSTALPMSQREKEFELEQAKILEKLSREFVDKV